MQQFRDDRILDQRQGRCGPRIGWGGSGSVHRGITMSLLPFFVAVGVIAAPLSVKSAFSMAGVWFTRGGALSGLIWHRMDGVQRDHDRLVLAGMLVPIAASPI